MDPQIHQLAALEAEQIVRLQSQSTDARPPMVLLKQERRTASESPARQTETTDKTIRLLRTTKSMSDMTVSPQPIQLQNSSTAHVRKLASSRPQKPSSKRTHASPKPSSSEHRRTIATSATRLSPKFKKPNETKDVTIEKTSKPDFVLQPAPPVTVNTKMGLKYRARNWQEESAKNLKENDERLLSAFNKVMKKLDHSNESKPKKIKKPSSKTMTKPNQPSAVAKTHSFSSKNKETPKLIPVFDSLPQESVSPPDFVDIKRRTDELLRNQQISKQSNAEVAEASRPDVITIPSALPRVESQNSLIERIVATKEQQAPISSPKALSMPELGPYDSPLLQDARSSSSHHLSTYKKLPESGVLPEKVDLKPANKNTKSTSRNLPKSSSQTHLKSNSKQNLIRGNSFKTIRAHSIPGSQLVPLKYEKDDQPPKSFHVKTSSRTSSPSRKNNPQTPSPVLSRKSRSPLSKSPKKPVHDSESTRQAKLSSDISRLHHKMNEEAEKYRRSLNRDIQRRKDRVAEKTDELLNHAGLHRSADIGPDEYDSQDELLIVDTVLVDPFSGQKDDVEDDRMIVVTKHTRSKSESAKEQQLVNNETVKMDAQVPNSCPPKSQLDTESDSQGLAMAGKITEMLKEHVSLLIANSLEPKILEAVEAVKEQSHKEHALRMILEEFLLKTKLQSLGLNDVPPQVHQNKVEEWEKTEKNTQRSNQIKSARSSPVPAPSKQHIAQGQASDSLENLLEESIQQTDHVDIQEESSAIIVTKLRRIVAKSPGSAVPRVPTESETLTLCLPETTVERIHTEKHHYMQYLSNVFQLNGSNAAEQKALYQFLDQGLWAILDSITSQLINDMLSKCFNELSEFTTDYVQELFENEFV